MTHWVMVIDTTRCIGCKACITACSQVNEIPNGLWRKLSMQEDPMPPERRRLLATRSCMHCEHPPCHPVCPTGATYQREDGIVGIDQNKCIGCSYCILACPYDARVIYRNRHSFEMDHVSCDIGKKKPEGVCTKCNFCADRIDEGLKKGLVPGVDENATPMCVVNCTSGALHFGDRDDPNSTIYKLIKDNEVCRVYAEVETGSSVYYILEKAPADTSLPE